MDGYKLSREEKKTIEDAALALIQVKVMYDKKDFFEKLKYLMCATPMANGYGDMSELLSGLTRIINKNLKK
tara:strand:+ start:159 stop:371 length:213 start_codon:yes stop_codon:yes gene_type:complete